MKFIRWPLATAALMLVGCGSSEPPGAREFSATQGETPSATRGATRAQGEGAATAAEVAEEMRGGLRCPPKIKSAARDPRAPVDDVLGVRPGLSYEEAASLVMCTHDLMVAQPETGRGFDIKTYGQTLRQGFSGRFAQPRVQRTSKQIMKEMQDDFTARSGNAVRRDVLPGQSKWYVGTMGLPGEERVISAAREEWFAEGEHPALATVEQALLAKYGTPTRNDKASGNVSLRWAYDPLGRLVTETSPLFHQCAGVTSPDGGANFSPDCGVVVAALVAPLPENPQLGRYLQVGVIDQAGGYAALTATQRSFEQIDAQRRATEVEAAAKNNVPKL